MTEIENFDTKVGKRTKISFSSIKMGIYPFLDKMYKKYHSGTTIQKAMLAYMCQNQHLLDDDPVWKKCIKEASTTSKVPIFSSKEWEKMTRKAAEDIEVAVATVYKSKHKENINALRILLRVSGIFKTITMAKRLNV